MEKLSGKKLLFYTIDQAINYKFDKKIILNTSDTDIIKSVKNRYKSKINIYKRDKKFSFENTDMKNSIIKSVDKFCKKSPDLIVVLAFQNPLRESFYIEKAINTMLLNSTKSLYSVKRDNKNNYFFYGRRGLRPIRSNYEMKLEREVIYLQRGGIRFLIIKNIKNQKKLVKSMLDIY